MFIENCTCKPNETCRYCAPYEPRKWSDYHVKYTSFDDLVRREEDKAAQEYPDSLPGRWAKAWKIAEDFVQKWISNITKD